MEDQPTSVAWVLLGAAGIGVIAVSLLRSIPSGHLGVVVRRGVVARVVGRGVTVRPPTSSEVKIVPIEPTTLTLAARGTTRDGVHVRLLARADVRLVPPTPLQRYVDPLRAGAPVAERLLGEEVGAADLDELPGHLGRRWAALSTEIDRETAERGLRVVEMELVELDAVLHSEAHG